jgi:hypothetical protein
MSDMKLKRPKRYAVRLPDDAPLSDDLYMSNDEALKVGDITPSRLSFVHDGQEVMAFGLDGAITVSPDTKADDAARAVIGIILNMWPSVLTEARTQGAADERERLAPHLHTAIAVITEMLEREGISDPETFPPLVEIRAAWLRSQKDTTQDKAD